MSKRSYDESSAATAAATRHGRNHSRAGSVHESTNNSSNNGLPPINELLSPTTDDQESHGQQAVKKPRSFIATVACENCRLKKTRCDESRPKCGLCKTLGLECVYNERKLSKKDHSLSLIMSTLHRLETKLENIPSSVYEALQPATAHVLQAVEGLRETSTRPLTSHARTSSIQYTQATTPSVSEPPEFEPREPQDATDSNGRVPISFSQHGVVLWPGARTILPERLLAAHERLGKNYVIDVEMSRPPLPMYIDPFPPHAGERWLETIPFAIIKGLSDAYFATFNPISPIMDKNFFFSFTIGRVMQNGFGHTMETCIVLTVMALGCLAVQAYQQGNYPLPGSQGTQFEPPEWIGAILEEQPGLRFFNEARRRIGFLMCENDIQSCQFYLLSSLYYTQIIRPMDSWAMINRAATCCLSMLNNHEINFDEWEGDMKSRVFWNTLMYETILVQELHLAPSGLSRLEDYVPIPKFINFSTAGYVPRLAASEQLDDSFFQYHFLAQVAHRIILTRIRHTLYFFSESGTFPHPAINTELHHQVEQWRLNLPPALQFSDHQISTPLETAASPSTPVPALSIDPRRPVSPATAVAESMLRGRYMIAKFHIGRPYLYKALRIPNSLTKDDLEQVKSGLQNAMDWPVVQGVFRQMKACIPIKFAFCSQFFGQILLFYCISHSPNPRLRETLPLGWERWYDDMFRFIEDCAPYSPSIAKDLELLRLLV
ncbi:transcriptional regulator family: Fungal Specific TF [Paecilomyces variotii]|nr:transcriptional regulator family: Fungal Specific TF [Paecilomyces variotii]